AFDHMGDLGAEELFDVVDGGQRIFDDVVQQSGRDRHRVQFHVSQEVGDRQRVNQVGLAGMADLSPVFERGEDIRPPQQLDVGVRAVGSDFLEEILEANHGNRCLTCYQLCLAATIYSVRAPGAASAANRLRGEKLR